MYTGRLVRLREYRREDIPLAQAYLNDKETRSFLNPRFPFPYTLADEEKWFESNSANNDIYSFALETLSEGKYIGGYGNDRAGRCYEKCGFVVEGVLRQEVYSFGQYHDMIIMGILRSEWDARQGGE